MTHRHWRNINANPTRGFLAGMQFVVITSLSDASVYEQFKIGVTGRIAMDMSSQGVTTSRKGTSRTNVDAAPKDGRVKWKPKNF
jgi:hypothetical protein